MIKEFPPNKQVGRVAYRQAGKDLGINELRNSRYSIPAVFYK
jgi:hypothetical protein